MPGYWNEAAGYYEGDRQGNDPSVPAPQGPGYAWDGSAWAYTLEACHALRRAAYPPLTDQMDAQWKGGEEAEAMRERVLAVKALYPKPAPPPEPEPQPAP